MTETSSSDQKDGLGNCISYLAIALLFIAFGISFVLFSLPAIIFIVSLREFPSTGDFLKEIAIWARDLWIRQKDTESLFTSLPIVISISFVIGVIAQQMSGTISAVVAYIWNKVPFGQRRQLFSFQCFLTNELGEFKVFLLKNKHFKSEWEWELIHFYCYWYILLNWTLFLTALVICCWRDLNGRAMLLTIATWSFFLVHAIGRSRSMYLVNAACLAAFKDQKTSSTGQSLYP